jgi:hypothetical protein
MLRGAKVLLDAPRIRADVALADARGAANVDAAAGAIGRTRTTTSSLNPNQSVVAVASMRPEARSEPAISQPMARAASRARANDWAGGAATTSGRMFG